MALGGALLAADLLLERPIEIPLFEAGLVVGGAILIVKAFRDPASHSEPGNNRLEGSRS